MVMNYPSSQETISQPISTSPYPVRRIVSGGQTGADQGGLEAGRELGIETGGSAPYNWMTETGPQETLLRSYGLVPGPFDPKTYPIRTRLNVLRSDGTVIFGNTWERGTALTIKLLQREGKPYLVNPPREIFLDWLVQNRIQTLNVAGNRESKNPGLQTRTKESLIQALRRERE